MRLLPLTDAHGQLDLIGRGAGQPGADTVVHAGDFGF